MTLRLRWLIAGSIALILIAGGVAFMLAAPDGAFNWYVDDMPGEAIGDNPRHIRESKLPRCNFNGAGFVEEPCYSPPNSFYL